MEEHDYGSVDEKRILGEIIVNESILGLSVNDYKLKGEASECTSC